VKLEMRIWARSKQATPFLTSCLTAKTDLILNIPFYWYLYLYFCIWKNTKKNWYKVFNLSFMKSKIICNTIIVRTFLCFNLTNQSFICNDLQYLNFQIKIIHKEKISNSLRVFQNDKLSLTCELKPFFVFGNLNFSNLNISQHL